MAARTVSMTSKDSNAVFQSFYPTMDSLKFTASEAVYDMDSVRLNVGGIPYIRVADAQIIPDSGKVVIHAYSDMDSLFNSTVLMDTVHFHHKLYDGHLKIKSRNEFNGVATFEYVNASDDTLAIFFDHFEFKEFQVSKRKTELHTQTMTNVDPVDSLHLSSHVLYKGPVVLNAHEPNLTLDGWVLLDLHGKVHVDRWLKNLASQREHEIVIDLDHQDDTLFNGISMNKHFVLSNKFLEKPPKENDQIVFSTHGAIYFNKEHDQFEVASFEYLDEELLSEPIFAYSESHEEFRFQGPFNLMNPMYEKDQQVDFKYAATGFYSLDSNQYDMHGIGVLNYDMPSKAFDEMGENLADVALMMGTMG